QHRHAQSRYVLCILRICRRRRCERGGHAELRRRPDHRQPRSDGADHGDRGRPGRRRRDQRHRQRRQQSFAARRLVGAGRADDVDQPQQCAVAIWRRRDHNDRQGRLAVAASGADHDRGAERQQQRPDRADRGRRQLCSRVRHVLQHASRRQLHQHRLARSAIRGGAVGERQPDQQRRAGPRRWDARVRQQPDGGREPDQHRHAQSRYVLCILRICRGRQCECRGHAELRRRPDHRQPRSDGADHGDRGRPGRRRRDQRHRQRRQQSFAARRLVGAGRADDAISLSNAQLQYGGGAITTIGKGGLLSLQAVQITIEGQSGNNSALTGLTEDDGSFVLGSGTSYSTLPGASFTNTGSLDLQYGGALSVSGNLTNSGALGLDDGTPGSGSSLTVGGNLTNTGTLNLDTFSAYYGSAGGGNVSVAGTLNYGGALTIGNPGLTAPTTVTAGALVGAGAISVTGSGANKASLLVGSLAPGALTTSISLSNAQLQYGGGAIT